LISRLDIKVGETREVLAGQRAAWHSADRQRRDTGAKSRRRT